MCPNIKLDWLRKYYDADSVKKIRAMILARFEISYPPSAKHRSGATSSHPKVVPVYILVVPTGWFTEHFTFSDRKSLAPTAVYHL
jgi:hypothetical protein